MPPSEINALVLNEVADEQPHKMEDIIQTVLNKASERGETNLYASDVKSAVLGLLRRQQLDLTDEFKVQRLNENEVAL